MHLNTGGELNTFHWIETLHVYIYETPYSACVVKAGADERKLGLQKKKKSARQRSFKDQPCHRVMPPNSCSPIT